MMDRFETIELLLDHYNSPRHHGPLAAATVSMPGRTPGCGDEITIYLQVDKTGTHVGCVQFEGTGCTVSQALASLLTERVQACPARASSPAFGRTLPRSRTRHSAEPGALCRARLKHPQGGDSSIWAAPEPAGFVRVARAGGTSVPGGSPPDVVPGHL
ncbi:MAG: hypothetical protein HC893_02200 [Chloroflexaceae bacterium]|nr:hypothetical protein [Chloroflexaceae bacterium]